MYRILIAEEIPSLNKGEAAILLGMLESFKTLGKTKVSMISSYPESDATRYNGKIKIIPFISLSNQSPIAIAFKEGFFILKCASFCVLHKLGLNALKIMKGEIWKEYSESDLVIVGHDGMLENIHGCYRSAGCLLSLLPILFAKLLEKRVVIYGASIGPFKNKLVRSLVKFALNKVDLITLREEISYEYLQKIGINKPPIYVTADLAFLMQPAPIEKGKAIMSQENINPDDKPIIGMTLSMSIYKLYLTGINSKEKYSQYIKLTAQFIDYLIETLGATIVFIPHSIKRKQDDRISAKEIHQMVKNKNKFKLLNNEYSPNELKSIIGLCDFFIGERTHSIIASTSMNVPSISISEPLSHRNQGIIGKMLGMEEWIINIKTLDFNIQVKKVNDIWPMREKIKKKLISKVEVAKERALFNGELIKDLLANPNSEQL